MQNEQTRHSLQTLKIVNFLCNCDKRGKLYVPKQKVSSMFTNYDVNRWKLSFSYNIPYQFTYGSEYYTEGSVYNLLKLRDYARVRFLNGGCEYDDLKTIDSKIDD